MADARVFNENLMKAFAEGAGTTTGDVLDHDQWMVVFTLVFDGTEIRTIAFAWSDRDVEWTSAMDAVISHLEHGPGASVVVGITTKKKYEQVMKALSSRTEG